MLLLEQLACRTLEGDAGAKSADRRHVTGRPSLVLGVPADRRPDLRTHGIGEARWHDADDRHRCAIDGDRPSDDRRIAVEDAKPETMTEQHDAGRAGLVLLGQERSAEHRSY